VDSESLSPRRPTVAPLRDVGLCDLRDHEPLTKGVDEAALNLGPREPPEGALPEAEALSLKGGAITRRHGARRLTRLPLSARCGVWIFEAPRLIAAAHERGERERAAAEEAQPPSSRAP